MQTSMQILNNNIPVLAPQIAFWCLDELIHLFGQRESIFPR